MGKTSLQFGLIGGVTPPMGRNYKLGREIMFRKTVLYALALASIMWCGCAAVVDQQLIDKPIVEFTGMSVKGSSLFEATAIFNFRVTNPNPMGLSIRNIEYNFELDNKKFIKGVTDKRFWLKPVGSESLSLSVPFSYMSLFESIEEFIEAEEVIYELSGSVGVGAFAVSYNTEGYITVPAFPKISLKYIDISDFSLTRPFTMIFGLSLKNTVAAPFPPPEALGYRIKLRGKEIVRGSISRIPSLDGNKEMTIRVPATLKSSELDWSANNLLTDESSEYELSGDIRFYIRRIGERNFSFHKKGTAPFIKR